VSAVDRGARFFWTLVVGLGAASGYFATGVQAQRAEAKQTVASIETGDVVQLVRVIDGDTITVKDDTGLEAQVRLLGIKTFEQIPERDPVARFGKGAVESLEQKTKDAPLRVLLNTPPQDRHGRYLATLYVGDSDLGLVLVQQGLAMVYTVYPFPSMGYYIQEQTKARTDRRGIWGDDVAARRADALAQDWRKQSE